MLRDYQEKIVAAMEWDLKNPGNSLIVAAQGAGKSHIIAEFAKRLNQKVLILVPSRELVLQNLEKLEAVTRASVFSASLNRKEIGSITIGTIQSIHKNPELFKEFDIAILDEADLYPPNKEGMYSKLFREAGIKKVFGLTATPYRLDSYYHNPDGWANYSGKFWQRKSLEVVTCLKMITRFKPRNGVFFWARTLAVVNPHELQAKGYLSKLTYHDMSIVKHEDLETNKSKSDFDVEKFDHVFSSNYERVARFVESLNHQRKLVFCSSIAQANSLQTLISGSMVVTSETPTKQRKEAIKLFRSGEIKVLLGVMIFVVGFDVPELDCIVSLRPTKSLRLWSQLLGRGARKAEGKETCHVYDYVSNIKNLGTLESIKVTKIGGLWNVVSDAYPQGLHGVGLYVTKVKRRSEYV